MVPYNRYVTVTQGKWSVSSMTGHLPNGQAELSVFIPHKLPGGKIPGSYRTVYQYGELNGQIYLNSDKAHEAAYLHGYSQVYRHARVKAFIPRCNR
jgi:hypothetical protein